MAAKLNQSTHRRRNTKLKKLKGDKIKEEKMRRIITLLLYIGMIWGIGCSIKQPDSISVSEDKDAIHEIQFHDFTLTLDLVLGRRKEKNNRFYTPVSITSDEKGNVYILDFKNSTLKMFSNRGEFIETIARRGRGHGKFENPRDAFFEGGNNLYIADNRNRKIQVLTTDGEFLKSFKLPFCPGQIAANKDFIYVSPRSGGKFPLYKYSKDGKFIASLGMKPKGESFIHNQASLSVDPMGNIYLAHWFLPTVQVYTPDGTLITQFEYSPTIKSRQPATVMTVLTRETIRREGGGVEGRFTTMSKDYPICYDMAVDSSGTINLLVASDHRKDEFCTLYRFDPSGNLLEKVGLPILCGRIHIDDTNSFYFLSPTTTKLGYKYKCVQK